MSDTAKCSVKYHRIRLCPADCAMDLGDGSERGEYVDQDYILQKLGRPLRAINLMYCYYPLDEGWPRRASEAFSDREVNFAWDYPYDDYFPYDGGLGKDTSGRAFEQMREIRRHGQDVVLTLTMDPHLPEEHITAIARQLRSFGHLQLRINHEATGDWFSFNKRASYAEVALFFAKCCEIVHREAPNVQVILCLDGFKEISATEMEKEHEFIPAIRAADIVSVDRYLALHWGWPNDIAEPGGSSFARYKVKEIYELAKRSAGRYHQISGRMQPMVLSELNADGDVTGPYDQVKMLQSFCNLLKKDPDRWLRGFTLYQFRDRGRLGLEIQDPNNEAVGIEQPLLASYRTLIHQEFFSPKINAERKVLSFDGPISLRWGGSEDAEGISLPLDLQEEPVFCEAYFEDGLENCNLLMELAGRWFYKAPGVKCIDLMSAFYPATRCKKISAPCRLALNLFAPPVSGENEDLAPDAFQTLPALPKLRILTHPVA